MGVKLFNVRGDTEELLSNVCDKTAQSIWYTCRVC